MTKAHQARSGSTSVAVLASLHNATWEIDGVCQGLLFCSQEKKAGSMQENRIDKNRVIINKIVNHI